MVAKRLQSNFNPLGHIDIVGKKKRQIFGVRFQRLVCGELRSLILNVSDQRDAGIACVFLNLAPRVIRRSIIHDLDLQVLEGLKQNALDRPMRVRQIVVKKNNYRN